LPLPLHPVIYQPAIRHRKCLKVVGCIWKDFFGKYKQMATGYILIIAILVLGGVIATVGDRIGTRVGKKRLSLFNLRPKNTAVLVTILS